MAKFHKKIIRHFIGFNKELAKQMLTLATSGFGLVAALAWNEVIKETIDSYIKPLVGGHSTIISLLVYAVVVTLLAVIITYNLSRIVKKS